MMRHLKNALKLLFVVFSLQIGIDGIIMSYFSNSGNPEIYHLTSDYCINNNAQHSHEDDPISFSLHFSRNIVLFEDIPAILFRFILPSGYTFLIWQPPKF